MSEILSDVEMDNLLSSEKFGHLGCSEKGKPYVFPLAYVFYKNVLYGQTTEGKKIGILHKNPHVCFQVQRQQGNTWYSVMCWGMFEELDFNKLDSADAVDITKRLANRLAETQDGVGISVPYSQSEKVTPLLVNGQKSTLFRIRITEKTGRIFTAEGK